MAMERGKLADIQTLSDSTASIYTNPAATKTYVRGLVLHNTNSSSEEIVLYNVPDSAGSVGTAAAGNQFFKRELAAGESVFIDLEYPIVLTDENDSLQAVADTASVVTVQVLGDKDA